jgi:uncharacterized membrane protein YfcA
MTIWHFTIAIAAASIATGFVGSLTGLGGGFIVVPVLTLGFGVDVRYAVGASLVCVIATSTASAARYIREGFSNIRIGMFLEVATTFGAVLGAWLSPALPAAAVGGLFGTVLLGAAYFTIRRAQERSAPAAPDPVAVYLGMEGSCPAQNGAIAYRAQRVLCGFGVMTIAGMLSGLLGIGSGLVKVVALDQIMGLPFKVAAATSSFMIGVTAAAAAGVHLGRGDIDAALVMPVVLGVLAGTFFGSRVLPGARPRSLRLLFAGILTVAGLEMIYTSAAGKLG